jgi:hypothetical protein
VMFPGNPAVYIRSVAFRPCLATGLASCGKLFILNDYTMMRWICQIYMHKFIRLRKGSPGSVLKPDFHFVLQEFFDGGNRHLTPVKDAGRQGRFGRGVGKDLQEMVRSTGSA